MHLRQTFVLGGAASGKSAYAEALAADSGKQKIYLATAQAFDAEMSCKIDKHIARRGRDWITIEAPLEVVSALKTLNPDQICLLDCATMWLSNLMLAEKDIAQAQSTLIRAIRSCAADLVVVSNEVGQSIVPENALAREFREAQGRLNIALATECDAVVQVIAGLPQVLKGSLP